ncbi:MAG: prenyltransferase/squalene oxidase repeat-containing protein [Caldilinea sp.]|uniref:prenyltransferase/squalene oxidase repeat-containing protein n=1 Tax=Caldilinea sp. TaxID=2293560 RepID=UPI0030B4380A
MKRQTVLSIATLLPVVLVGATLWLLSPAAAVFAVTHAADRTVIFASEEIDARAAQTETLNTAAIVVQFDDRRSVVREVEFDAPISGLEALQASGLDVTVAETSFGPAVCAIEGVGCPADDCFCNPDLFWSYNFWDGENWQSYPVGAASSVISQTGAIEGWRWGAFGSAQTPPDRALAAARALAWLRTQQDPETGGFGESFSSAVEVLMALGANHERPEDWRAEGDGRSLDAYLLPRARSYSLSGAAPAGKLAVAFAAADACRPARTVKPSFHYSETLGAYAADSGPNAWAILGATAVSETIPADAVDSLKEQQQEDGGWEWQAGFGTDTNTTALAVQALIAAGEPADSPAIAQALAFLASAQQENGGFVYDPKTPEYGADANSTAYVIQAILAAGGDPAGEDWTKNGATPFDFLLSLQLPEGAFEWQPETGANLLATAQAVPALLGHSHPIAVRDLEFCADRRLRLLLEQQE